VEPAGNLKGKFAGWLALVAWLVALALVRTTLVWSGQVPAHYRLGRPFPSRRSTCTAPLVLNLVLVAPSPEGLYPRVFTHPHPPFLSLAIALSPLLDKMDSPQDTPSADHQDDQQAKSSYVAHILPSISLLPPLSSPPPHSGKTPVVRGARACTVCRAAKVRIILAPYRNSFLIDCCSDEMRWCRRRFSALPAV
jgi:hypothetical protein